MNIDSFKMNPYHFFDSKLLALESESIHQFNWQAILEKRKQKFPGYHFFVTDNEKVIHTDFFIAVAFNNENMSLHFSEEIIKNIYWINLHSGTKETHISSEFNVDLIHENLVPQNIKALTHIALKGQSTYTNIIDNQSNAVFHQYLFFTHTDKTQCFFLQKSDTSKNKVNQKHYLTKESASTHVLILNTLINEQLRDDFVEFEHLKAFTNSKIDYFAMNGAKAVSQVNSIIPEDIHDCETHQLIKHIMLNDTARSFSKPNLMIKNPNVIASHGNSIGSYNDEELFFLMQRGITNEKAKEIIQKGIINKALEKHPLYENLKEYFND